jgi:hypothetical protein
MATQISKPWNDINLPGFSSGKKEEGPAKKFITGVDDSETNKEEPEPEVRLISAEWKPGPKGYQHNEQCFLDVKAEYLKETIRARIRGRLFAKLDGEEIDLAQEVEGFIDKGTSIARMDIKKLWFAHLDHYKLWLKDKNTLSQYTIKSIAHSRGTNEIDSPVLDMPAEISIIVNFIELPDVHFNHNSAVPCIDAGETLIGVVVAALVYAFNNSDKETILYGHTDSSGETDFNLHLSELRCKAVKALIDNDQQAFVQVCNEKSKIEDYQTILSVLTSTYGWECNPGEIDNQDSPTTQAALKAFQSDYNIFFEKSIDVDGAIGQQTWGAFFEVIREMIWIEAKKVVGETNPTITYGDGTGIHACGEQFAEDTSTKKGRKSKKDRRVEICFMDPADPIEETPYTGPVVMEPIVVKPIEEKPAVRTTPKLTGFEMWCSHEEDGKKRIAKPGQALEIVPSTLGDRVTVNALPNNKDLSVDWVCDGHLKSKATGQQTTFKISGFTLQVHDVFENLMTGNIFQVLAPRTVKVTANDTKENTIIAYPNNLTVYEVDFSKIFKWLTVFQDKFNGKLKKILQKKIEPELFVGKVGFEGGYAEESESNKVFYKFSLKGGFDPLLGLKVSVEFPLMGILSVIPSAIRAYIADLKGVITIKGGVACSVSFNRPKLNKHSGKIETAGSLATSVSINVLIGNGKILEVIALLGSGIEFPGSFELMKDSTEKWKIDGKSFTVEWAGLKGELSWALFDGRFSKAEKVTIIEPSRLYP